MKRIIVFFLFFLTFSQIVVLGQDHDWRVVVEFDGENQQGYVNTDTVKIDSPQWAVVYKSEYTGPFEDGKGHEFSAHMKEIAKPVFSYDGEKRVIIRKLFWKKSNPNFDGFIHMKGDAKFYLTIGSYNGEYEIKVLAPPK